MGNLAATACVPMGLSEMGLIKTVHIDPEGGVDIELRLTSPFCEMIAFMRNEAIAKVGALQAGKTPRLLPGGAIPRTRAAATPQLYNPAPSAKRNAGITENFSHACRGAGPYRTD